MKLSFQVPNVVGPKPSPPPPVNPQFAVTSPRPVTTTPSPRPPRHRKAGENLSHLVFGDKESPETYIQGTSCCVMYLTLEGEGSSDTESVRVRCQTIIFFGYIVVIWNEIMSIINTECMKLKKKMKIWSSSTESQISLLYHYNLRINYSCVIQKPGTEGRGRNGTCGHYLIVQNNLFLTSQDITSIYGKRPWKVK